MNRQMSKNEKLTKRFLALLLAFVMIFQQSYVAFATEGDTEDPVVAAQEAEEAAQAAEEATAQQAAEEEAARIAAEEEAARIAAEEEAARRAAEEEAARIAAEQAAAQKAAEEAAAQKPAEDTAAQKPAEGAAQKPADGAAQKPADGASTKKDEKQDPSKDNKPAAGDAGISDGTPEEGKSEKPSDTDNSNGLISIDDAHDADTAETPSEGTGEEDVTSPEEVDAITIEDASETVSTEIATEGSDDLFDAETEAEEETETEKETETEATKVEYQYEDTKVSVTAILSDASQIPDDAELKVQEVTPTSNEYNYDAYMEALNDATVKEYDQNSTLLYDIAFIGPEKDEEGNPTGNMIEFQPAEGTVQIKVTLKKSQISEELGAASSEDVDVLHLPLKEEVKEATETTASATDITAEDINVENVSVSAEDIDLAGSTDEITFDASEFSVFAFTVDFYYEGFEHHVPGNGTYLLTDILAALKITLADDQPVTNDAIINEPSITLVEAVDEANPEDIIVSQDEEGNWTLVSSAAFDDVYELKVEIGSAEYKIRVEDEPQAATFTILTKKHDSAGNEVNDTGASFTGNYYLRLKILNKTDNPNETPTAAGWVAIPFTWNSDSVSVDITEFANNIDGNGLAPNTLFDPALYTIETTSAYIVQPKPNAVGYWFYGWNSASNSNNVSTGAPDGYQWNGTTQISDTQYEMRVLKSDPVDYFVRLKADSDLALTDFKDAFVRVKVDHNNSDPTFAIISVSEKGILHTLDDGSVVVDIPVTNDEWIYESGNEAPETFTGKESKVTVEIVGENSTSREGVPVNEYVNRYSVVSYPSSENGIATDRENIPIVTDSGPRAKVIDTVVLARNNDKFSGYTLENILKNYNVVTLCPNTDGGHEYNGVSWGNGDFYDGAHMVSAILVRGDWLTGNGLALKEAEAGKNNYAPSVIGGRSLPADAMNYPLFGNEDPSSFNVYLGKDNSVFGNKIVNQGYNGQGYNKKGTTIVNGDFIDWELLQNVLTDTSEAIAEVVSSDV